MKPTPLSLDAYFDGWPLSRRLFDLLSQVVAEVGSARVRVTRSQVAFSRRRSFAWAWIPGKYLTGHVAPLVLSLSLQRRDPSPRWKEVVQSAPGRFMHHLEIWDAAALDGEARRWLAEAWRLAG